MRTLGLDPGADQHLLHAVGCRRAERRFVSNDQLADVDRMKAVHVFRGIDPAQDFLRIDVLRQRELYQNSVDLRVGVEPVHRLQQLVLGRVRRHADGHRVHAGFLAGLPLGTDIDRAGRILADKDRCQTRLSARRGESPHVLGDFGSNGLRNGGAVENSGAHRAKSTARVSRMTTTLIWPGYCSSLSIFRAIDSDSWAAAPSSIRSGVTTTRISRPAWITLLFSTPVNALAISSRRVSRFT